MRRVGRRLRIGAPITDECERYRPSLLVLLVESHGTALPPAARSHLDACDRCRAEVSSMVLAGLAVRRTFATAASAMPPDDSWPRLRHRLERPRQQLPRFASSVAGLILAAGMATALVFPAVLPANTTGPGGQEALAPAAPAGQPGAALDDTRQDPGAVFQSPIATSLIGIEMRSQDQSRARIALMRYELAPQHAVHTPRLRSLNASAE
jgi:hypothetical protein